jgi:hypothetical protein
MYMLDPIPRKAERRGRSRGQSSSRFFFQGSGEEDSPALALDTAETERSGLGESTTTFSQIEHRSIARAQSKEQRQSPVAHNVHSACRTLLNVAALTVSAQPGQGGTRKSII